MSLVALSRLDDGNKTKDGYEVSEFLLQNNRLKLYLNIYHKKIEEESVYKISIKKPMFDTKWCHKDIIPDIHKYIDLEDNNSAINTFIAWLKHSNDLGNYLNLSENEFKFLSDEESYKYL